MLLFVSFVVVVVCFVFFYYSTLFVYCVYTHLNDQFLKCQCRPQFIFRNNKDCRRICDKKDEKVEFSSDPASPPNSGTGSYHSVLSTLTSEAGEGCA